MQILLRRKAEKLRQWSDRPTCSEGILKARDSSHSDKELIHQQDRHRVPGGSWEDLLSCWALTRATAGHQRNSLRPWALGRRKWLILQQGKETSWATGPEPWGLQRFVVARNPPCFSSQSTFPEVGEGEYPEFQNPPEVSEWGHWWLQEAGEAHLLGCLNLCAIHAKSHHCAQRYPNDWPIQRRNWNEDRHYDVL
jgi:hypothetical protein